MKLQERLRRLNGAAIDWERRWRSRGRFRRLLLIIWAFAMIAAAWQASGGLDNIYGDGICYLDIAGAINRGDWATALNSYWSPLYPAVLAIAMRIIPMPRPSQFYVLQAVNCGLFLAALVAFHFFLRSLIAARKPPSGANSPPVRPVLTDFRLYLLGYTLFLWTSLWWVGVATATPDMLVTVFIYTASGLSVRAMRHPEPARRWFQVGAVLGAGYLAKLVMLPVSLLFGGVLLAGTKKSSRIVVAAAAFGAGFAIFATPFAYSLSRIENKWTWGESGRLNYIFWVAPSKPHNAYWRGGHPPGQTLEHVPSRISSRPLIYDISRAAGTYPIWFDPAYWNAGVAPYFQWDRQLAVLAYHLGWYRSLATPQAALILGLLTLAWLRLWRHRVKWSREGLISLIGLAMFVLYGAVHVELRYLGPFVTLFWIGCFSSAWWRPGGPRPKHACFVSLMLMLVLALQSAYTIARPEAGNLWRRLRGETPPVTHNRLVAREMIKMGVQPGVRVARVASSFVPQWAWLAGVRVVAEIPNFYTAESWQGSREEAQRAVEVLKAARVRYLLTERPVPEFSVLPWRPLADSGHSILDLGKQTDRR